MRPLINLLVLSIIGMTISHAKVGEVRVAVASNFTAPMKDIGQVTQQLGLGTLSFTYTGLVIASVFYSLPFVVQPIQNAIEAMGTRPLEATAILRTGPWDRFFSVVLPLARPGFLTAAVLGFTHTVGEFGVVLMSGGNIPEENRVVSVQIYDHVEAMSYDNAHTLAAIMIVFSFTALLTLYSIQRKANLWRF